MNSDAASASEQGLAPIEDARARVLILGSMPSVSSLRYQAYYAHPQNAFWPIMRAYCGVESDANYEHCCAALRAQGIAVWDVIASCVRPGSLDAAIEKDSIRVNDFALFLHEHPLVKAIMFNGGMAEQTFKRHCKILYADAGMHYVKLPSTSPAHAAQTREEKRSQWSEQLDLIFNDL